MWPVRKMDFHFVKRATTILIAKATSITMPISVPKSAPISTVFDATAWGITALKAAEMPSIELPVISPVPVDSTKKPTAVMMVPRTMSENGRF